MADNFVEKAVRYNIKSNVAYSIYTFAHENCSSDGVCGWTKHSSVLDLNGAMDEADNLFSSGKYRKVEVKKKYFDRKKDRNIDVTLKVFEGKRKGKKRECFVIALALAFFVSMAIYTMILT